MRFIELIPFIKVIHIEFMIKKRKTTKSSEHTSIPMKSPSSPLLNILKLPTLPKVSSPQMSQRFFVKRDEDPKKTLTTERKPTQSLYSFSFSKLAEEIKTRKNSKDHPTLKQNSEINTEQTLEDCSNQSNNFHVIHETYDENYIGPGLSHKSSISRIDDDQPVPENDRKSRQKTIKNEVAVETCSLLEEELFHLRKILKVEQERCREIEMKYVESIDQIKSLHEVLSEIEDKNQDYQTLFKSSQVLKSKLSELESKSQSDSLRANKQISELKEDLNHKTEEISLLNSMLAKTSHTKARYAESISELESSLQSLKSQNLEYKSMLEKVSHESLIFNSRFLQEKSKVEQLEETQKQIDSLRSVNYDQQDKITFLERQIVNLTSELNEFRLVFNSSKSKWRDKKKEMKKLILTLNEKLELEANSIKNKIADAFKSKRSITLREKDESLNGKEALIKMQQRILDLEMELSDLKLDRDKFKASVEYCKGVIETKNTIVAFLEEQVRKGNNGQLEGVEGFDGRDLKQILRGLKEAEGLVKGLKELVKCQVCLGYAEFFMVQCEHFVCSTCQGFLERCPVCAADGKICCLDVLKKVAGVADGVLGILQGVDRGR